VGQALGKGLREFRKATSQANEYNDREISTSPEEHKKAGS
jgi:Sec-independent protein translocase protein TatA